jgi:hypothetical protein
VPKVVAPAPTAILVEAPKAPVVVSTNNPGVVALPVIEDADYSSHNPQLYL